MRSEGLCNRISKELVRKRSRFSHFPEFGSKGPKWGLEMGPEGSERDAAEWV